MIKNYNKLSEQDKQLFDEFKQNYIAANSSDIKIEFIAVKREKHCLRVDLLKNNRATYQEVFTAMSWG